MRQMLAITSVESNATVTAAAASLSQGRITPSYRMIDWAFREVTGQEHIE